MGAGTAQRNVEDHILLDLLVVLPPAGYIHSHRLFVTAKHVMIISLHVLTTSFSQHLMVVEPRVHHHTGALPHQLSQTTSMQRPPAHLTWPSDPSQ